jgi:thiamine biosynthesis lipoprotein
MNFLKRLLTAVLWLAIIPAVAADKPVVYRTYVSHFENVLGTSMEIKIIATGEAAADAAENAALQEIARLNGILSAYDAKSEFSRWMKTSHTPVTVSKELYEVLSLFDQWRSRSGGALNASAETIGKVWKQAAAKQQLPAAGELSEAVALAQQQQWVLDSDHHTATRVSAAPLALNSFTKSYIIRHAAETALASGNIQAVVLNIGGDIVVKGGNAESILISNPKADAENDRALTRILVTGKAIATSGNYRRGVQIGSNWYSHIVDPRNGQPASEIISATVVANDATDAGALATAFNVLSPEESKQLAASVPGAEYLLVTKDGKQIASEGWKEMEVAATPAPVKSAGWNSDFELAVNFEIALIEGTRVRRPFVAVWIEDSKGIPVRNISVWFNRDRWLPDLKGWYRNYSEAFKAEGNTLRNSVSSATRAPGKYTVKWDGKDDKGEDAKPGKYTVIIEAVREHGTYQLMKQDIEIKRKPSTQSIHLAGNAEIASASIELRKRSDK